MKITLDKAIELLTQAAAIILPDEEGTPLMYPSVNADEDDFLSMSWTDEEGYEYTIDCLRGKETEVEIEDNCLIFKTDEGFRFVYDPLFMKTIPQCGFFWDNPIRVKFRIAVDSLYNDFGNPKFL